MVTKWGLSKKMGPLLYTEDEGEVFLGHSVTKHKEISDETAKHIDEEIKAFIDTNYDRAYKILTDNINLLHIMAKALVKYETLDAAQVEEIMTGKEPTPPQDWDDSSKSKRPPSSGESQEQQEKSIDSVKTDTTDKDSNINKGETGTAH